MPLNVQVIRNGEPVSIRWGEFHVAAMAVASSIDGPDKGMFKENHTISNPPPFGMPEKLPDTADQSWAGKDQTSYPEVPMPITREDAFQIASYPMLAMTEVGKKGSHVLINRHRFVDCTDGEVFELLPGDELRMSRSSR